MGSVHRIDNGVLIAEYCQIDDVAFRGDVCVKLHLPISPQSEDEERRYPKIVSSLYFLVY